MPLVRSAVSCPWIDEQERWRALLTVDGGVGVFCPECAGEFGDD